MMYGIVGYEMMREAAKIVEEIKSTEQNTRPAIRLLGKLWLPTATHPAEAADKSNMNCSRLDVAPQK